MTKLIDSNRKEITEFNKLGEKRFTGRYWFDGRKIYSMSFKTSTSKKSEIDSFSHGIKNVDVIWTSKGCFWQSRFDICHSFGFCNDATNPSKCSSAMTATRNSIHVYIGEWLTGSGSCDIFIEVEFIEKT